MDRLKQGRIQIQHDSRAGDCALCLRPFVVQLSFIQTTAMKSLPAQPTNSSSPRHVTVREVPIELCQFIKFAGLSESGGEAKRLISEGRVLLNGTVESQKRKKLAAGDQVKVDGHTIIVKVG